MSGMRERVIFDQSNMEVPEYEYEVGQYLTLGRMTKTTNMLYSPLAEQTVSSTLKSQSVPRNSHFE